MIAIAALLGAMMIYPYLPGRYDALAVPLSTMAQLFGTAGLLVVPIGVLWLIYEVRQQARRRRAQPVGRGGFYLALAALIVGTLLAIAVCGLILLGLGYASGALALALLAYLVSRWFPRLRRLRQAPAAAFNPAPLYLIFIPLASLVFQVALAGPARAFSRSHAIAQSAELIAAIEQHRAEQGRYPSALIATWPDYLPGVVGIAQYHYAPSGGAYNLVFEQPMFLFDQIGTREFVVYNPLDQHVIASHAAWILLWSPDELAAQQGWYTYHQTASPHWRYFWFD
jgi:hypothetical protein